VTLCFLENPIDFKALDGKPVHILFTMISPTVRIHLHLLSRLGFMLRDPAVLDALQRRASADELLSLMAESESAINRVSEETKLP